MVDNDLIVNLNNVAKHIKVVVIIIFNFEHQKVLNVTKVVVYDRKIYTFNTVNENINVVQDGAIIGDY